MIAYLLFSFCTSMKVSHAATYSNEWLLKYYIRNKLKFFLYIRVLGDQDERPHLLDELSSKFHGVYELLLSLFIIVIIIVTITILSMIIYHAIS